MKSVYGEITLAVSLVCDGLEDAERKVNEWNIGNRKLILVDDEGNRIGVCEIHNVGVKWDCEIDRIVLF